jgi:hypothetical protein
MGDFFAPGGEIAAEEQRIRSKPDDFERLSGAVSATCFETNEKWRKLCPPYGNPCVLPVVIPIPVSENNTPVSLLHKTSSGRFLKY